MNKRTRSLVAIAIIPAALVGGVLWWLTGLVPECSNSPVSQLESPDKTRSLVVFTRDCGHAGLNTQAAILPAGGTLDADASGFLALEGRHAPSVRWDAYGNLEVTIPEGAAVVQQQPRAGGISIIYN